MKYQKPLNDSTYPGRDGAYVDANPAQGVPGSTVPGAALEDPQRELVAVIEDAGLTPDEADLTQLLQAIRQPWGVVDTDDVARISDTTITITGDVTAKYPAGKRLRFNGSDTYLCRVLGDPTYAGGVTTVTVWFDVTTTIPAAITKFERSRLTPQDTANGGALTGASADADVTKLLDSYCCGSYIR